MKKPKGKGGMGVPDLYLCLGAHYTCTHMRQVMTEQGGVKTRAMSYYCMGSYLRKLKLMPSNLRVPVAFQLPPAYEVIKTFLTHFNLENESKDTLLNQRFLTSVVQARSDPIPVAGLAGGEAEAVWKGISRPGLPNRLLDLSWQVAHGILPVRDVMHSRGMAAKAACPRPGCGAPETVRHLLWECSAAIDLWTTAGAQDFPYLPAREVLTAHLVLYGVSQSTAKPEKLSDEERLTLAAIKDAIWTSRNLLVRNHMQIPPVAVIRMAAALRTSSGLRAASQGHSHKEESPL
ncbi:uncharacterized protein [Nothobranchius furzeri]|uniref:uncharacterized protein n=1 Tax=Nothobranchius furzeri TaxID=105023 RepID=UPI0024043113|nr:uncharacterized protein LOC129165163 [Nothobranchius furzeri]